MPPEVKVNVYCPVGPTSPIMPRLQPPPNLPIPSVIIRISCAVAPRSELLADLVATNTSLPLTLICELLALGAVNFGEGLAKRAKQDAKVRGDEALYVRVHATPKRHRARSAVRVLYDDGALMLLHEPPVLPLCATNNNAVDCVTAAMSRSVTTRLDIGTSGVLVLASPGHSAAVNHALSTPTKRYLVHTHTLPPRGYPKHWYARVRAAAVVR